MITYKELMIKLDEQKQVGTLYHFTTIPTFLAMFNEKLQSQLGIDDIPSLKSDRYISLTRNHALSTEIQQTLGVGWFSSKNGYVVRISVDGTKISNKYKIIPVKGMADNDSIYDPTKIETPLSKRVNGRIEAEELVITNILNLKPYIKQINFLAVEKLRPYEKELFRILDRHNIKHSSEFHRKWLVEGEIDWGHQFNINKFFLLESK